MQDLKIAADDKMTAMVIAAIEQMLKSADSLTEQAVILQLIAGTALHGLADTISPATTATWLRSNAVIFDKLAAEKKGELN